MPGNTIPSKWRSTGINGGKSHLLAKHRAAYRIRNETCTETEKDEMRKLKRRGFLHVIYF